MTEKIKALINKRLNEQAEIRESLGTGFPIEEDAKLRRLAALELVLDDLKSLVFDHQTAFAVGEYYSFTTYRKDYDADTTFTFKTLETKNSGGR